MLEITARSYAFLWREWRILVLPAVGLGAASALIEAPVALAVSTVLMAGFEVGLYRRVLLGEQLSGLRLLCVTSGLGAYAVAAIKLILCLCGGLLLLAMPAYLVLQAAAETSFDAETISAAVTLANMAIVLLFLARLVLILPGRVVGETISLRGSWQATKGHWLALLALFALTMAPFLLLPLIVPYAAPVLLVLSIPVRTVALSLSYRSLTGPAAPEAAAAP